jgi:hypothetical protein
MARIVEDRIGENHARVTTTRKLFLFEEVEQERCRHLHRAEAAQKPRFSPGRK